MARRRMNRTVVGTTPAAAPVAVAQPGDPPPFAAAPAAPPAPAPAPAPVAAVVAPVTTEVALPSNLSPALASIFGTPFMPPANLALEEDAGLCQVRLFTGKGASRPAVIAELGEVPLGTPYLYCPVDTDAGKRSYHLLGTHHYVMLSSFAYWAAHDGSYGITKAWEQDPGKTQVVNGATARVKECILSIGLIVPGKQDLPEELRPAVITLDTWRGANCRGVKSLLRAQVASTTAEWARQGANGAVAGAVPRPEMRVTAAVVGASKPTSDGQYTYTICTMFPATTGLAQGNAIGAWCMDAERQAEAGDYKADFDRLVRVVQSKI